MSINLSKKINPWIVLTLASYAGTLQAAPFIFDSGSTDADGPLAVTCTVAGEVTTVDVGATGIMNYSSITVDDTCILKFTPAGNSENDSSKPVRLIVSGDVIINGEINLDGEDGLAGSSNNVVVGGKGGPGGYNGGSTGRSGLASQAGYGPAGGYGVALDVNLNCGGSGGAGGFLPFENDPRFQSLVGGSGGGGGCSSNSSTGSGTGGGGALLIASSGSVSIGATGIISANNGARSSVSYSGGYGYDGMIQIIANAVSGSGTMSAEKIIIETSSNTSTFSVTGNNYQMGLQRLTLDLAQTPTLSIATIGGVDMSTIDSVELGASGDTVITLTSSGLAETTEVTVAVSGNTPTVIEGVTTLAADGSASVTVAIPSGISVITAYVSQSLTTLASIPDYNNEKIMVARLEVTPGKKSALKFFTESGKLVPEGYLKDPWQYVNFNKS